jgi:hypothetical protein
MAKLGAHYASIKGHMRIAKNVKKLPRNREFVVLYRLQPEIKNHFKNNQL